MSGVAMLRGVGDVECGVEKEMERRNLGNKKDSSCKLKFTDCPRMTDSRKLNSFALEDKLLSAAAHSCRN